MFRTSRFFATGFLAITLGATATAAMAGQPGRGAESSINPQPLPPTVQQELVFAGSSRMGPGSRVMINPQPLPPRQQSSANGIR